MIRYQLECDKGHSFEGWFRNSEAFDKLAKSKKLECEVCGSKKVHKALMAPSVPVRQNKKTDVATRPTGSKEVEKARGEVMKAMRELRRKVEENAEYVGPRFAEEARKIHYKETDEKGIYGEASLDEAKELVEEGIDFHALPVLPEDQN